MNRIILLFLIIVSPISVWGEIIVIPDPNLRLALEKALGKNEGEAIAKEDLVGLEELKFYLGLYHNHSSSSPCH